VKKVAILQSNYIPWKGYFDVIHDVDEFIIYDDVQYTKNDWRNRNQIKTSNGLQWLTIPVLHSNRFGQSIKSAEIRNNIWPKKHLASIQHNYNHSPFYKSLFERIAVFYKQCEEFTHLSQVNNFFITQICSILNINTKISQSSDYEFVGNKTERLINLCKQSGATHYLTGPAAKSYINENLFVESGIILSYKTYNYPEYKQLYGKFTHNVSILDLLFNCGFDAPQYIWYL